MLSGDEDTCIFEAIMSEFQKKKYNYTSKAIVSFNIKKSIQKI